MGKRRSRRRIENVVVTGFLAVVLTTVGMTLRYIYGYWRDAEACRELRDSGAHVSERYEVSAWWAKLARTVGFDPDFFGRKTTYAVRLSSPSAPADGLRTAARLSELVELGIYNAPDVDDDTLAAVRGCTHVRWLELGKTAVTDAGLRHLSGWSELRHASIGGSRVTHEGILFLVGLSSVQSVLCDGSNATGVTLHDLVFTSPSGTAPQAGQPLNVRGRLSFAIPLPAGSGATIQATVMNHDDTRVQILRGSAVVTPDAAHQAAFSLTAANSAGDLRPGPNSVHLVVTLPLKAAVIYRFDRSLLMVQPEMP